MELSIAIRRHHVIETTTLGIVPMRADVLMIGVEPNHFDSFQRMIKGGFQSMHMGWSYVANPAKTFEYAAFNFIPKRPDLDVIYLTNQVQRTHDELSAGARLIAASISEQQYDIKPYVVLDSSTEFLQPIFDAAKIVIEWGIEVAACERHSEKCRMADEQAA